MTIKRLDLVEKILIGFIGVQVLAGLGMQAEKFYDSLRNSYANYQGYKTPFGEEGRRTYTTNQGEIDTRNIALSFLRFDK